MDEIRINDLEVYCNHGVYPEENVLGQKFVVTAVLSVDTRRAGLCDDLECSVDYGKVCHFITDFMKNHTYKLIEAVAENLARQLLLTIPAVKTVTLTIKKPWAPIGLPIDYAGITITRGWHTAYVALGSNMGDRKAYLDMAVEELDNDENSYVMKIADVIETKPYGVTEQDDFLNGCVELRTLYTPQELLKKCNDIEKKANRVRELRWGPRTLDLDILLYDDEVITEDNLVIPHIEMQLREFVLKPLAQIAPYKMHPVLKKRIIELLSALQ